jgi:hypothetical protein
MAQPSVQVKTIEIETKNRDISLYIGINIFALGMTMSAAIALRNKEIALVALQHRTTA